MAPNAFSSRLLRMGAQFWTQAIPINCHKHYQKGGSSMHSIRQPKRERGQSLVELAISLTVILLLLSGAVDFGMAFFSYVALRDAAQEGALYGSMNPTDINGVVTRVRNASTNPVNLKDPNKVTVTPVILGSACQGSDNAIQVTVSYDYPIMMPFMGAIIGGQTIHLSASATDTILSPAC